ncbi:uncharacterized protein V6R79_021433 [Siganus canaliculatus]
MHEVRSGKETWRVDPVWPLLVLGDANVGWIPPVKDPRVQLDCFPLASIDHATPILRYKTPQTDKLAIVVLCFGLHNTRQGNPAILTAAKSKFPQAEVHVPLINVAEGAPPAVVKHIKG